MSCLLGVLVGPYYAANLFDKGYTYTNMCDYVSLFVFGMVLVVLYVINVDKKGEL